MTDDEVAFIRKHCLKAAEAAKNMNSTSETNKAIAQINRKAKTLRLELVDMPDIVRVNLPHKIRKMLEPEKRKHSSNPLEQALSDSLARQEPELLRLLRSIEDALQNKTAKVNKSRGMQTDYYAECVLRQLEERLDGSEYPSMHAMINELAVKFDLAPDQLYYRYRDPKKTRTQ